MSAKLSKLHELFPPCYVRAIRVPPLLAIYEPSRCGNNLFSYVRRLPRGAGIIFRGYNTPDRMQRISQAAGTAAAFGVPFSPALSSADDIQIIACLAALRFPVFGAHIKGTANPFLIKKTRMYFPHAVITSSIHNISELHSSQRCGVDLCLLSPLFQTDTHPQAPCLGNAAFVDITRQASVPVFALGGITTIKRTRAAIEIGAAGVASIGLFA